MLPRQARGTLKKQPTERTVQLILSPSIKPPNYSGRGAEGDPSCEPSREPAGDGRARRDAEAARGDAQPARHRRQAHDQECNSKDT